MFPKVLGSSFILLFIGGVLSLLLGYFKASSIIKKSIFKKSMAILWAMLFFIWIGLLFHNRPPKDRFRIAFIPTYSDSVHLSLPIVEHFSRFRSEKTICYPMDWFWRESNTSVSVHQDSIISRARRIGLHYLFEMDVKPDSSTGKYKMHCSGTDLKGNDIFSYEHRLTFPLTNGFLDTIRNDIENALKVQFVSNNQSLSLDRETYHIYGNALFQYYAGSINLTEKAFQNGLELDPTNVFFQARLAEIRIKDIDQKKINAQLADARFLEISQFLKRCILENPLISEFHRLLGRLYIHKELWNHAEASLKEAYKLDPDDPHLLFWMSRLHPSRFKETGYKTKADVLNRAIYLYPAFEKAWLALGDDLYYDNKPDEAIDTYQSLLSIYPNSIDGLLVLGKIYLFRNDILNIVNIYERVLELDPENADAYYNLGVAYYNDDEVPQAIRFFQRAITLNDHPNSHLYLGVIYMKSGEREKAIAHYRQRIKAKENVNDPFAEEARKQLEKLLANEDLEESQ